MTDQICRAYPLPHHANTGKQTRIAVVLPRYQTACKQIQADQWRMFVQDGLPFWNRREPGNIETPISERYKRSVQNQVVAGLDSWFTAVQDKIRHTIGCSSLPDTVKADLWYLNRSRMHYKKPDQVLVPVWDYNDTGALIKTSTYLECPVETLDLLRVITKHIVRHQIHRPELWHSRTMMLDGPVAQVERSEGPGADWWVRVSTLVKGKTAWVPLTGYKYFNKAPGTVANYCQVTVHLDSSVGFTLVKKSDRAVSSTEGPDIGLDWGLRSLYATEFGDLLGQRLYPWLCQVDTQLQALTASLQSQGVKLSTNKRYRGFQSRIRAYVVDETNRVLNRLVKLYGPRSLVVEDLDFRYGGLSKRLNRILSRAGRSAVRKKLVSLEETLGVTTHKVNSAYTSQQCSGCGYIDPKNRKGLRFVCGFCGCCLNADTNGARVISQRRSLGVAGLGVGRQIILQQLDSVFEARWRLPAGRAEIYRHLVLER